MTMRHLLVTIIIALWAVPAATATGAAEVKLIYFYDRGCHWCRLMDEVLKDPSIRGILERNTDIIRVDVHSRSVVEGEGLTGKELVTKHGVKGAPTFIFLSPEGEELLRIPGAVTREDFKDLLCIVVGGEEEGDCVKEAR